MDTSQKILAMGVGFLIAGLGIALLIVLRILPDQKRAKRLWAVVIPGLIVGIVCVVLGILMS